MQIRHAGIFVRNINKVEKILIDIGFVKVYDEMEIWAGKKTNIRKYLSSEGVKLELIQNENALLNTFHLAIEGDICDELLFDMNSYIVYGEAFDKNLEMLFVYIDDSIYFEFVKEKI